MAARAHKFLIWGGGGHGKVVADLIRALNARVVGYVDSDPAKLEDVVEPGGARVIVADEILLKCWNDTGGLPAGSDAVAFGIGDNDARIACLHKLSEDVLPNLIHPAATLSPSAVLGSGTVVFAGVVVNASARVGRACILNTCAVVEHDCVVSDGAHISPGAVLGGGAIVGERAWIGAGAVVIQGVAIGARSVVGAGSVVLKDVPDGWTAVGVPARLVHRRT